MKQLGTSHRGILHYTDGATAFSLKRYAPSAAFEEMIERYWIIRWDLRNQPPHTQETLPHPNINLVVERGRSGVWGISTHTFSRTLSDKGKLLGVKFKPAGFYPLADFPIESLTCNRKPIEAVLGTRDAALEDLILKQPTDVAMIKAMEEVLRPFIFEPDANATLVNQAVAFAMDNPAITRVALLAEAVDVSQRTLQRLFRRYMGVTPKWVVMRFRLHEAVERIEHGDLVDWAGLAKDLGYSDQAHFIRDFKQLLGVTPTQYADQATTATQPNPG